MISLSPTEKQKLMSAKQRLKDDGKSSYWCGKLRFFGLISKKGIYLVCLSDIHTINRLNYSCIK